MQKNFNYFNKIKSVIMVKLRGGHVTRRNHRLESTKLFSVNCCHSKILVIYSP